MVLILVMQLTQLVLQVLVLRSSFKVNLPHPHTHTVTSHTPHTVPPAPPTNLIVTNIGETSLDLSWTNGFNGLSLITGVTVTIYYVTGGLMLRTMWLYGDSSLQTTEISGLNPFTEFRITVTVENAVGSSDTAEITVMTLSLSKCTLDVYMYTCMFNYWSCDVQDLMLLVWLLWLVQRLQPLLQSGW